MGVAADIFITEYNYLNYHAYDPHSIIHYIDWYRASCDSLKEKMPDKTMTIDFESLLKKLQKVIEQLYTFLSIDLELAHNEERDEEFASQNEFRDHLKNLLKLDKDYTA